MQMLVDTWWWWWWPPAALRRTVRRLHRLVPPGGRGRADLREHLDADEAAKHACVADEARDLASTPRSLLGRAVARDEVDDGTARCRHDA